MKLSQVVGEVIRLARAIPRPRYGPSTGKDYKVIPFSQLPAPVVRPEKERLREFLLGQRVAVIYAVMTLMYLGRGDYGRELDFLERYTQLNDVTQKPLWAVNHMIGKLPLADYLAQGLRVAADLGIVVDDLLGD